MSALVQLPDGNWVNPRYVQSVSVNSGACDACKLQPCCHTVKPSVWVGLPDGGFKFDCDSIEAASKLRDEIAKLIAE